MMTRKDTIESKETYTPDESSGYVLGSWIAFWAGIFGVGLVAFPISMILANEAIRRGGKARLPRALSVLFLVLGILLVGAAFALFMVA